MTVNNLIRTIADALRIDVSTLRRGIAVPEINNYLKRETGHCSVTEQLSNGYYLSALVEKPHPIATIKVEHRLARKQVRADVCSIFH